MARERKTVDVWDIRGDYGYGHGFETVTSEYSRAEAQQRLREYRANERGVSFKIVKTREPKSGMGLSGLNGVALDPMTRQYLETALWSSTDDDQEPYDRNFGISDFTEDALAKAVRDCKAFQEKNSELYESIDMDSETAGHKFWLSRNRHGGSFSDDYRSGTSANEVAEHLDAEARKFGEIDIYTNDDGELEFSR